MPPKQNTPADAAEKPRTVVKTQTVVEDFTAAPPPDAYGKTPKVEKLEPNARGTVIENYV